MKSAREWKEYYARERASLGDDGLRALVKKAADAGLPAALEVPASSRGALVFPHARLTECGHFAAAVALSIVQSGVAEVLALGILHGGRDADAAVFRRAREGAPSARATVRRVHGEGVAGDAGLWTEEFSLDGFRALLDVAAKTVGKRAPRVIARYPFLAGEQPGDLPGMEELQALVDGGAALVATADPIHHGAGYGAREEDRLPREDPQTLEFARWTIDRGFSLLAARDFGAFLRHATEVRSDFRDTGPVMAWLVDPGVAAEQGRKKALAMEIVDLALVDYSEALACPAPTWVAAALAKFQRAS